MPDADPADPGAADADAASFGAAEPSDDRYAAVRERLVDPASATVATLPDGSVDSYCRVEAGGGGRLPTRAALAERVTSASKSIHLVRESREPGGQCVNMAQQAHALGDETTCYGFLDHPALADLPFRVVSMGPPADIRVCTFPDDPDDVVFALDSEAVADWTLADLERVADLVDLADAVCVGNWVSCPGLTDALPSLAEHAGSVLVVDPGDLSRADPDAVEGLLDALAGAADACPTVVSANGRECRALGDLLGVDGEDDALRAVHDRTGAAAALHGRDRAAVATADGILAVPALELDAVERRTGAGDRWSAALAHARALSWSWGDALALANACAGHYVARGETAAPDRLRSFLGATGP